VSEKDNYMSDFCDLIDEILMPFSINGFNDESGT
jgi:hypothetical protein